MTIETIHFGIINGEDVELFTLKNTNGIVIKIMNYGGIITSIETPDKNQKTKNIVLGFETFEEYVSDQYLNSYPYFGAIIGRVGNRIAKSQFEISGKTYKVSPNRGDFHLHGGFVGFDKVLWKAKTFQNENTLGVELRYLSVDGEEGYPGNLEVKVVYSLNNENEFLIEYFAQTDKATPVNLTQHSYFNLGDEPTVEKHKLLLNSNKYLELNSDFIPTGNLISVVDTLFDFRQKKGLNDGINAFDYGYDINFCFDNDTGDLMKVAELTEDTSGRKMEVYTTEIGMQLYTGAYNPVLKVNGEEKFGAYSGVALETQHYPDSVNHKHFSTTILQPGKIYDQKTLFKFS